MLSLLRRSTAFVSLVLLAASARPTRAGEFDKFLPKETDVVISLNVKQVLDSALIKKNVLDLIKATLAGNKQAQDTMKALGLDPLADFSRVSVGVGLDDPSNPKAVIVVEGKFDVQKIGDVMDKLVKSDEKKFAKEKAGDKTVYKIATPDQPMPFYAAPIDAGVMVLSTSKEYVGAAFAAAKGAAKLAIKKELADLISKADSKSSIYVVAYTKGKLDAIPLPDANMKKIIEQIQHITVDLKVEKDANLELAIGTDTADAAKQMQMLLAGGLDLAKLQVKVALAQMPELTPLIDLVNSMKAVQKEKAVVITGNLSGDAIEKMLKSAK